MTAYAEVEDELCDLLADEAARIVETYAIWLLSGHSFHLRDAQPIQQFHHQVRTAAGLTYARSTVSDGHFELDEIGNEPTAARVDLAARSFDSPGLRLLVVPARQMTALWKPDVARLVQISPATEATGPIIPISADSFERLLSQLEPESSKRSAPFQQAPRH
jgi:hypothetical protein